MTGCALWLPNGHGGRLLARHGFAPADLEPAEYHPGCARREWRDERVLVRSEAACYAVGAAASWPAVGVSSVGFPGPARDLGYRLIARWRYRIWGGSKRVLCHDEERERFL